MLPSSEAFLQLMHLLQEQHEKDMFAKVQEIMNLRMSGAEKEEVKGSSSSSQFYKSSDVLVDISVPEKEANFMLPCAPPCKECPDVLIEIVESMPLKTNKEKIHFQEIDLPQIALVEEDCPELDGISDCVDRNPSKNSGDGLKLKRAKHFRILNAWEEADKDGCLERWRNSAGTGDTMHLVPSASSISLEKMVAIEKRKEPVRAAVDKWCSLFTIHPARRYRTIWSIASLVLLCYDVAMAPIECFIGLEPNFFLDTMEWVSRLFWTFDVPLNFFTGFFHSYVSVELRPSKICSNYIRSWLLLDVGLVGSDWFSLTSVGSGTEYVKALRAFRMSRMMRLARVAKFKALVGKLLFVAPGLIVGCASLLQIVLGMCVAIHVLSCLWFRIGTFDQGWASSDDIANSHFSLKYSSALHLTFTHIHGTSFYEPRQVVDYSFSIFMALFGFIFTALVTGKTVHTVNSLSNQTHDACRRVCREYLQTRNVSMVFQYRMNKYLRTCHKQTFRQQVEHETELLQALPEVLRKDLHEEVRAPLLLQMRFFSELHETNRRALRTICTEAIECLVTEQKERLFHAQDACYQMYFVESGCLTYILQDGCEGSESSHPSLRRSSALETTWRDLTRGDTLCEAALWTQWIHCGEMVGEVDCTVLSLQVCEFLSCMKNTLGGINFAVNYARHFISKLNGFVLTGQQLSDVMEVDIDWEHIEDMPDEDKAALSEHLLFLSHYKEEAGTEATLMEQDLERMILALESHPASKFSNPCFLDSSDLIDLSNLKERVKSSHNLVVLLTPQIFTRPWCLVEIVTAVRNGVNLVPVEIQRPGLQFKYPSEQYYEDLTRGTILSKSAVSLLKEEGIELTELATCIQKVFVKIAVPFSPHKSSNIREAELNDILERCLLGFDGTDEAKPSR